MSLRAFEIFLLRYRCVLRNCVCATSDFGGWRQKVINVDIIPKEWCVTTFAFG